VRGRSGEAAVARLWRWRRPYGAVGPEWARLRADDHSQSSGRSHRPARTGFTHLRTQAASGMAGMWLAWHVAQEPPADGSGDAPAGQLREAIRRAVQPVIADARATSAATAPLG
jgi:hypothetical protein